MEEKASESRLGKVEEVGLYQFFQTTSIDQFSLNCALDESVYCDLNPGGPRFQVRRSFARCRS